jgi:hypothetical protein
MNGQPPAHEKVQTHSGPKDVRDEETVENSIDGQKQAKQIGRIEEHGQLVADQRHPTQDQGGPKGKLAEPMKGPGDQELLGPMDDGQVRMWGKRRVDDAIRVDDSRQEEKAAQGQDEANADPIGFF